MVQKCTLLTIECNLAYEGKYTREGDDRFEFKLVDENGQGWLLDIVHRQKG